MSKTFVEIKDKDGRFFKMKFTLPRSGFSLVRSAKYAKRILTSGGWFGGSIFGEWEGIDQGFIRLRSGKTRTRFSGNGDLTTSDLLILGEGGVKMFDGNDLFGMQLFQYEDILGRNSQGEGFVIQPWVVGLTPGRIFWKKIS